MGANLIGATRRHWPLLVALTVMCATVEWLFTLCVRGTQGHFAYVCDDAYIHMAVAKNFAEHGVWGVTPYAFSSSASSILWPFVLSVFYHFVGPQELVPLVLNVAFAAVTLLVVHVILTRLGLPAGYVLLALLGVFFLASFPGLIFTGMEHSLQVLITIAFVYLASEEIAGERCDRWRYTWICTLAILGTLIRYEALFVTLPVCVLFSLRGRWRYAFGLGAVALSPALVYGAVCVAKGWPWLPASILLKGNVPATLRGQGIASGLISGAIAEYGIVAWSLRTAHVLSLMMALLVLFGLWFYEQRALWKRNGVMIVIFAMATTLHLRFAAIFSVSGFERYEAYLLALGVFAATAVGYDYTSRPALTTRHLPVIVEMAAGCLIFLPITAMWHNAFYILRGIPTASRNIYEQDYQMGLFLGHFYRGVPVAVNDIGAVGYLSDSRVVDLQGLGSLDVLKNRTRGQLSEVQIDRLTKSDQVRIAVIYDRLFENGAIAHNGLPPQWIKVGQWRISDNFICWDDRVSFFAVDTSEEGRLTQALRQFYPQLPRDVQQSGIYTTWWKLPVPILSSEGAALIERATPGCESSTSAVPEQGTTSVPRDAPERLALPN